MPARAFRPVPEASSAPLESRGSIVGAPDIDEEVEFGAVLLRCKLSLMPQTSRNRCRMSAFGGASGRHLLTLSFSALTHIHAIPEFHYSMSSTGISTCT